MPYSGGCSVLFSMAESTFETTEQLNRLRHVIGPIQKTHLASNIVANRHLFRRGHWLNFMPIAFFSLVIVPQSLDRQTDSSDLGSRISASDCTEPDHVGGGNAKSLWSLVSRRFIGAIICGTKRCAQVSKSFNRLLAKAPLDCQEPNLQVVITVSS